jgi:hypothetical protein
MGVIIAAIVLGLFATGQLLFAALMALSGFLIGSKGIGNASPRSASSPPPAHS